MVRRIPRSPQAIAGACALLICAAGCAPVNQPIFPESQSARVWPEPPNTPRLRYVGELTGEGSLKAPPKGMNALRAALTGEQVQTAFVTPTAVAVAGSVVFVADGQLHGVHRLDLEQRAYRLIQQADGQPLGFPIDLLIADQRLIVVDSLRAALFEFDLDGNFLRRWPVADLQRPSAIARDAEHNLFWVSDTGSHNCVALDRAGRVQARVGGRGAGAGEFNYPTGLCWHAATGLCVVDSMNFRVQELSADGRAERSFGRKGDAAGDFSLPRDVAVDRDGHIYVLDNQFENVQIFDAQGRLLLAFGQEGKGPGEFSLPSGITIDVLDRIWIADTYNRRVQLFQYLRESRDGA